MRTDRLSQTRAHLSARTGRQNHCFYRLPKNKHRFLGPVYIFMALLLSASYALCFAQTEEPQESAIAIVLNILKGGDQEMQTAAIAMVKDMPGTEVTRALCYELPNLSVTSQVQLLSALADRGDPAALPAVLTATRHTSDAVRIAALKALGQLGNDSTVPLLAQRAANASGAEQKAARESLYRLHGSNVDETILAAIDTAQPGTKVELIRSIAQRNIYRGVDILLKTAKDPDDRVRIESFKTLKFVADQQYLPALVALLINLQGETERSEAERAVAAVARKIGSEGLRSAAIVNALPSAGDPKARCSLINVLGKIGDNASLDVLRQALHEQNVEVQTAAVRALAGWPGSAPLNDLLKVAQSSELKIHRILALRGYIRLIGLDRNRPTTETINLYKQAMTMAADVTLKRQVLAGLAKVKAFTALKLAAQYLADKTLQPEAESAVVKIAKATSGSHPQETTAWLKKIMQTTKNDAIRQQAQALIDQIKRFEDYLTAWQVSGPYTKNQTSGTQLFDIPFAPEEKPPQMANWTIMPAATNPDKPWLMELDNILGGDNRVAYLRNKVWSDKNQKVQLELGSDDGIKVWLNGQLVHSHNVTRTVNPGDDKVEVTLKKGWNRLLLKVSQNSGQWAVCARFRTLHGNKLKGLKMQAQEF